MRLDIFLYFSSKGFSNNKCFNKNVATTVSNNEAPIFCTRENDSVKLRMSLNRIRVTVLLQ